MNDVYAVLPAWDRNAVDVMEALRSGVASCSVRALLVGMNIERLCAEQPPIIQFGFRANLHGKDSEGGGKVVAHAFTRVRSWEDLIVDSYDNAEMQIGRTSHRHLSYDWFGLMDGYFRYASALCINPNFNPDTVLEEFDSALTLRRA